MTFNIGGKYLVRRVYNSKNITWQPAELLESFTSDNGEPMYRVKFLEDGKEVRIRQTERYTRKREGRYILSEEGTLLTITKTWVRQEQDKAKAAMQKAQDRLRMLGDLSA